MGGINDASTQSAVAFYGDFVDEPVAMKGMREAETAKLLENTFRHVNIALVNEMSKFCKELNIDIWEVIRGASTKPFGFMKFTPGPRRRRSLHPDRPELPLLRGAQPAGGTPSASSSWRRRSTTPCLATSWSASRNCSTSTASR